MSVVESNQIETTSAAAIRPASADDAAGMARVLIDTFRATYSGIIPHDALAGMSYEASMSRQSAMLRRERCASFVAVQAGTTIAFVTVGPFRDAPDTDIGEIYGLYVNPQCQRRGLGRALMRNAVGFLERQRLEETRVWVLSANPARMFYQELGASLLEGQTFDILGERLPCVCYRWPTSALSHRLGAAP